MKSVTLGLAFALVLIALSSSPAEETRGPLKAYLDLADDSYQWTERRSGELGTCRYTELRMVSQTWRDIIWKHQLFIIKPASAKADTKRALLFITGGRWRAELDQQGDDPNLPREANLFALIAERMQSPVAVLLQVPHQPILDNRVEDEAIAYTFDQYIRNGDPHWPLLLPMVKSAVRAMDTVQQFAQRRWEMNIESFTVSGASKRGWTTWLTGATDARVTAIAPIVIDMLNMNAHLDHQQAVWGDLSRQIDDYTSLNLHKALRTERGQELQKIVDPYNYRQSLLQPKLIIIGTNDDYWPLDALNLYWDDLSGPKYILYVPNNGHGIRDYGRVVSGIYALHRSASTGVALPRLTWTFSENGDGASIGVRSDVKPDGVRVWIARSATRDFRQASWDSHDCRWEADEYRYLLPLPKEGYVAMFGESIYTMDDVPYQLSTNMRVYGTNGVLNARPLPAAGAAAPAGNGSTNASPTTPAVVE